MCRHCAKGRYANQSGSIACDDCPAGRYGSGTAETSSDCTGFCAEGHYGDQPGATSRQCAGPCAKGEYSRPGALACKLCPEGRYNDVAGTGVTEYTDFVCIMCNYADYTAPRGSKCCLK